MKDYIILALIFLVFISPFLFAYYKDYKDNPKEFLEGLKGVLIMIAVLVFWYFVDEMMAFLS